jgi:hypothetical protein
MPDSDPKAERGGDKGVTHTKGKGPKAEKGDQRREYRQHEGQTRERSIGDDRPGSESNPEHKDKS